MNSKANILAGLLIGLGLLAMGLTIRSGIRNFKEMDRVVVVKGLAEREVVATKVIWPISYTEVTNNLESLYAIVEARNHIIKTFLVANGIQEAEISLSAPVIVDLHADRYNNTPPPFRYNVTCVVTVSSPNVELVRSLMVKQTDLLKKGIAISGGNWQYQAEYLYTKLNDVKPSMIEDATKNARATAEKFAEDSKSKLGKITKASQGQIIIENRDANTPYIKTLRVVTTIEYQLQD